MGPERSEREKGEGERRGEAKQAARCSRAKRATAKRARAGVASWAACVAGRRGKEAAAQASRPRGSATEWAAPGRAGRERGREKKAGLAGPEGDFLLFFFKSNVYQILFSPFSFLSQIQISFEYKFQIF